MPKRKAGQNLGKALCHSMAKKKQEKIKYMQDNKAEMVREEDKPKLTSCVERGALDDFLYNAEISQAKFEATKGRKLIVRNPQDHQIVIDISKNYVNVTEEEQLTIMRDMKFGRIPRRPKWDGVLSVEEQQILENKNFIDWRRDLAIMEETYRFVTMTPYEKNVEIWKQLWRVLERSDIVAQILDARDPLFFRCDDLEKYVKEISDKKMTMLLINKADLVDVSVRKSWSNWLNEKGIDFLFFSAQEEQEKIDIEDKEEKENKEENPNKIEDEEVDDQVLLKEYKNTHNIVDRANLLRIISSIVREYRQKYRYLTNKVLEQITEKPEIENELTDQQPKDETKMDEESTVKYGTDKEGLITLGLVGFPNVGKSSILNVLCKKKLVGVDCRPGKTKNYQTIFLSKDLLLCDSPGLVFPSAASSKCEMICNGVLPIDNLKDFITPIEYIVGKIPKRILSYVYKIDFQTTDEYVSGNHFLFAYSANRGYVKGSGQPDITRASRIVLKEYVAGKLLYCNLYPELREKVIADPKIQKDYKVFNEVPAEFDCENEPVQPKDNYLPSKKQTDNSGKFKKYVSEDVATERQLNKDFFGMVSRNQPIIPEEEEGENGEPVNVVDLMQEEDIVDLIAGKVIYGVKLNKDQKRQLKWAIKRDETTDAIEKMLYEFIYGESLYDRTCRNKMIKK